MVPRVGDEDPSFPVHPNTIIADFFPCASFYSPSGVTRDPYMAWRSISQSGAIILSAMHYGI